MVVAALLTVSVQVAVLVAYVKLGPSATVAVMVAVPQPSMFTSPVLALIVAMPVAGDMLYVTLPSPNFSRAGVNAASP